MLTLRRDFIGNHFGAACWVLLAAGALAAGCGEESAGPQTYPVTGVVTLAGEPVGGAMVQFTPAVSDLGTAGSQTLTGADGDFDVSIALDMGKTMKRGLPAGEYGVSVRKMEVDQGPASLHNAPKNVLPAKYADPRSSGFKETVAPDKKNHFEFRLSP